MPFGPPVSVSVAPAQTGPLFEAWGTGKGLTTAVVETELLHPLELTTVSVYVPDIAVVAVNDTVGLWEGETKPFGPVHEYEAIPDGPPARIKGVPAQTGPLLDAVGTGNGFIITLVMAFPLQPFEFVTVRVYTPAIAAVADDETTGFCWTDVNPLGPVHS